MLRAGNVFHFMFAAVDHALIDATTLQVEDVPNSAAPQAGAPYPQSLRLRFKVHDAARPPRVLPLAPGHLRFRAASPPAPPEPAAAVPANYLTFPTVGRLMLTVLDTKKVPAGARMEEISGLPVVPGALWFSPVQLPPDFLFTSLPLLPSTIVPKGAPAVKPTAPNWLNHAVSGFLKGLVSPVVGVGPTPADDDAAKIAAWPTVVVTAATREVELIVTAASTLPPFDGEPKDFELPQAVEADDPAHPGFGAIPARHVYRSLRSSSAGGMIGAATGSPIADRILSAPSTADLTSPGYRAVRFTRIWKPERDCSVHFPSQVVHVRRESATGAEFAKQRLPCHGILFLGLSEAQRLLGSTFAFSLENAGGKPEHELLWLTGEPAEAWRDPASGDAVSYDLQQTASPHIIARRRMGIETIYDRRERPTGDGCTAFSMRRSVRALVNNRIAGGRLNFEVFFVGGRGGTVGKNKPSTRRLVRDALGAGAAAANVLDGQPDVNLLQGAIAAKLLVVFERLFPDPVQLPTAGAGAWPLGKVAYYVWQSGVDLFKDPAARGNFADDWLGGGGAGALVATGLAADYAVNPGQTVVRTTGESDASFRARIVAAMRSGAVQPGAALQFWSNESDLKKIRNRTASGPISGHSPMFLRPEPNGMTVLDQGGDNVCSVGGEGYLEWHAYKPDIWIAANWLE
jgi:hypothetical protein